MTLTLIISIVVLAAGGAAGFVLEISRSKKLVRQSETKRDALLRETQAEAVALRAEAELEIAELQSGKDEELLIQSERIKRLEERVRNKEDHVHRRLQSAESKVANVAQVEKDIVGIREQIEDARRREVEGLSKACGVPVDHAVETMLTQITEELERDKLERLHRVDAFLEEDAEERAKSILLNVIQRYSLPAVRESHAMMIDVSNKKVREKFLWKGTDAPAAPAPAATVPGEAPPTIKFEELASLYPNIAKLQELTGVECELDEQTEVLLIHQFDLLKRTIAKMALDHVLSKKKRVMPEDIVQAEALVRKQVNARMDELGKKTLEDLGIRDFDPRMTRLIGRLAYRTSFGQNIISHSTEVAFFSGLLAGEVGADVKLCRRAGLVHDLGKGIDADVDGPHDVLSRDICVKLNFDPRIIHAAYAHHEQVEYTCPEDVLVQVADAISASRPGARQEATEQYVERIQALEMLASSFSGVSKAYAIQAGREIRVIVEPEEVSDADAAVLAKDISLKIQEHMTYPGEIMVNVIRETSAVDYAR